MATVLTQLHIFHLVEYILAHFAGQYTLSSKFLFTSEMRYIYCFFRQLLVLAKFKLLFKITLNVFFFLLSDFLTFRFGY